jgi:hypothetical protein
MFQVNREEIGKSFDAGIYPTNIHLRFISNTETLYASTDEDLAKVLKMPVEEYRTLLVKQFKAKTDGNEISFTYIQHADIAVQHLNVLYKLMNAK